MSDQSTPGPAESAAQDSSTTSAPTPAPRRMGTWTKIGLLAAGAVALVAVSGIGGFAIGHATADRPDWSFIAGERTDGSGTDGWMGDREGGRHSKDHDRHGKGHGDRHGEGQGDRDRDGRGGPRDGGSRGDQWQDLDPQVPIVPPTPEPGQQG